MKRVPTRSALLLTLCLAGGLVAPVTSIAAPPQAEFIQRTLTYKVVGETRIEADVYRADDDTARPVILWIHGGALIFGSRSGTPPQMKAFAETSGYVLVSIDHRLAPEVKLPEIVDDVEDAIRWIRHEGPELFGSDPDKLVVAGASAGGYLALLSGFRVTPRPTAIASFWGYGAADAPFESEPSEFYRSTSPLVNRADAFAAVGGEVLTATGPGMDGRWPYYLYLRQQGLWLEEVSGLDPLTQQRELDSFASVRNVDGDFPPTVLVHGTNDEDVAYAESAALAAELLRHGVVHQLVTVEGAGHGLSGVGFDVLSDAIGQALAFIDERLGGR